MWFSEDDDDVDDSSQDLTDFSDAEVNLDNDDLFCIEKDIQKVKERAELSLRGLTVLESGFISREVSELSAELDDLV